MAAKSAAIRRDFATHHLSAGENREELLANFLSSHLPTRYGVSTGLVFAHNGVFSRQADLLIVDHQNNSPLHSSSPNKLWPVEAVYALIEVKTHLQPQDIADAIEKGRRFKQLMRGYAAPVNNPEALFLIWSYEAPSSDTAKDNYFEALRTVPRRERPDLLVVPNRFVARSGGCSELAHLGSPGGFFREQLVKQHGADLDSLIPEPAEMWESGENSLIVWYLWVMSWLQFAGPRFSDLLAYAPADMSIGRKF